jgi:hypothetical protein
VGQFEGAVDGEPVRGTVAVVVMSCLYTSQQRRDVATAPGVVREWRGWPHKADSDGDARSCQPDVTAWSCISTWKILEGLTAPLRGRGVLAVWGQAAQCHGADTGLAAQCRTAAEMASPRELAK